MEDQHDDTAAEVLERYARVRTVMQRKGGRSRTRWKRSLGMGCFRPASIYQHACIVIG